MQQRRRHLVWELCRVANTNTINETGYKKRNPRRRWLLVGSSSRSRILSLSSFHSLAHFLFWSGALCQLPRLLLVGWLVGCPPNSFITMWRGGVCKFAETDDREKHKRDAFAAASGNNAKKYLALGVDLVGLKIYKNQYLNWR